MPFLFVEFTFVLLGENMSTHLNKVVVIDTGITIDKKMPSFNRCIDGYKIQKSTTGYKVVSIKDDVNCIKDDVGHGTGVAELIVAHNKEVELIIVKIFDSETQFVEENLLIYSLEFLLEKKIDFDLVNLSMGLCCVSESEKLKNICRTYYEQNKCIVAAFDNTGSISFPAAYEFVIGVTGEDFCLKANEYYTVSDNRIVDVCAKGRPQMIYWKDGIRIWAGGNSYACAHLTGILSNFEKEESINLLKMKLEEYSSGVFDGLPEVNLEIHKAVFEYKKVAIFPFNKETHSLVRFSHMLSFEIVDVFDLKYTARVGAMTDQILGERCHNNYLIKDINDIDMNSFDTFILGHTEEISSAVKGAYKIEELIEKLIKAKKYVYSFDDIFNRIKGDFSNELIFSPQIDESKRYIAPFGKLYRQDKPILGIFGTSSKQGKFTLQLRIRYNLLNRQYKICQIGTEPSSLLFGMDDVFHNGYNSGKILNQYDAVAYLNKLIYDRSRDADIVIVGGQSGIVLRDSGNLSNYYFKQIDFLFGTLPDVAVLCFNSFDDISIINRAIMLLKSAVDCDVIALVLFPFYYERDDVYRQRIKHMSIEQFEGYYKDYFESSIGLPVIYPNSEKYIDKLCDMIISYFKAD